MDCPVCKTERLSMMERQGIEIEFCPNCRGVWLDRGELDKIVERSAGELAVATQVAAPAAAVARQPHEPRAEYGHGGHRRKSFLQELFD